MLKHKLEVAFSIAVLALPCTSSLALAQSPQPLNAEQKQIALETFQSATLGTAAADSLNPQMAPGTPGQDPLSQKWLQMSKVLQGAVQTGACRAQSQQTTDPHTGGTVGQSFSISGSACQVQYLSANGNPPNSLSSTFTDRYQVLDSTYRSFTDVDSFNMDGQSSISQGNGNTFNISVGGSGTMHSQRMGDIPFGLNGGGTFDFQGNAQIQVTLQANFPGFAAALQESTVSHGNTSTLSYSLNGVPLSDDEVKTYINLPFLPQSRGSTGHLFGILLR